MEKDSLEGGSSKCPGLPMSLTRMKNMDVEALGVEDQGTKPYFTTQVSVYGL